MDMFNLISALNPAKVKTGNRPRAAHEVPLLTVMANRVIDMEDTTWAPPLENPSTTDVVLEPDLEQEVAAIGPLVHKRRRKRGNDEADANAPSKVLRKDHVAFCNVQSTIGGKSLSTIGKEASSTITPAAQDTPAGASSVKDPDPLSSKKTVVAEDPDLERSTSFTSMGGSPGMAMGSQLRLRFEQEAKLLKKSVAQLSRRDQKIEAKEKQIKNIEALLKAEADMKKAAEAKNAELIKELEGLRGHFSNLQLSNQHLSQQVVEQRCAEMDARLDKLSVNFDEELYPHMLTAIEGRRWVIGHDLRLTVMKCGETPELRHTFENVIFAGLVKGMSQGLEHGIEHGKADRDLEAVEAYDPEAHSKYLKSLKELKDLKYPLVDQLVRDPRNPWAIKEEILLEDAIAANVSRAEKKKKCRVVCHTHGVSFAHHARSEGVPISAPTDAPQGLAILLADASTQTEISEGEASPRLLKSMSLPAMYNLDWP
ncbi:hypothetical protein Tco_0311544 [Tanacetum coccineum]